MKWVHNNYALIEKPFCENESCIPTAYSEPCQTSQIVRFAKIVKSFEPLTVCVKGSILDVLQGSQYASVTSQ